MVLCRVRACLLCAIVGVLLACAPPAALAAPASRDEALGDLEHAQTERRAEAVAWIANHGGIDDQALLLRRLRDKDPLVREFAEQGLWLLWGRSGDAAIDALMARGSEQMQTGRHREAVATFTEVIRRRPEFAEGWNKRATVHFFAGDYPKSLADCDEVMRRNPYHFGALSGYGQIYFRLEQYERAIEYWRRALDVNPNMTGVEINLRGVEQLLRQKRGRTA